MKLKNCLIIVSANSTMQIDPGEDARSNVILQADRIPPQTLNILRTITRVPLPTEHTLQEESE